jgi:DNA invertase Pin-like site-specific DNA recombinase
MRKKNRTPALAYLRTSSTGNVGADKDSDKRQRAAIEAFAGNAGYEIIAEFWRAQSDRADPKSRRAFQEHRHGYSEDIMWRDAAP